MGIRQNSLYILSAPERTIYLAESIEEQLEVYGLNKSTPSWKDDGCTKIVGDLFDLKCVLHDEEYCFCCEVYHLNYDLCPINSPSIKGCSKELMELL